MSKWYTTKNEIAAWGNENELQDFEKSKVFENGDSPDVLRESMMNSGYIIEQQERGPSIFVNRFISPPLAV